MEPADSMEALERWEGVPLDDLARGWGVPALHTFRRVGSTNDVARRLALAGAPVGTCVLGEEQLAGRGREGRSWSSPPLLGLWMSIVLGPAAGTSSSALPIRIGLAVAQALDPFCKPLRVQLKWPNDLLLGGQKLGGILCESSWEGNRPGSVIAGIGLNLLHTPEDFPPELRAGATSIRIQSGWSPPRVEVAGAVARAVLAVSSSPALAPELVQELAERDALRGRTIVVSARSGETLRGDAAGIDSDGCLRLHCDGSVLRVRAGTVRLDEQGPV